jgi:hypothetical protein
MRNAVCIGSTSILSNYALDVTGNIITTGNIALANASRSIFWTGTNATCGSRLDAADAASPAPPPPRAGADAASRSFLSWRHSQESVLQ